MPFDVQVESQFCPSPKRPNSLDLTSCLTLEMVSDCENINNSINNNSEDNISPFNRSHKSSSNKKKKRRAADIPEKQFKGKITLFWGRFSKQY